MLTEIFFELDEFCLEYQDYFSHYQLRASFRPGAIRGRKPELCLSEVMAIVVYYPLTYYQNFKRYYTEHVLKDLTGEFPNLVSYGRMTELIKGCLHPLLLYLTWKARRNHCTGISYVDSAKLIACHPKRAHQHKVMKGLAEWGKTSVGWFYGIKYHLVISHLGEILNFAVTSGSTSDNNLEVLKSLTENISGKLFGDKGYLINKKKRETIERGGELKLITKVRKNMKKPILAADDSCWLNKRGVVESAINIQKEILGIEHTRHRSPWNALTHLVAGLVAYDFRERKPSTSISLKYLAEKSSAVKTAA